MPDRQAEFNHVITSYLNGNKKQPDAKSGINNIINGTGGNVWSSYNDLHGPQQGTLRRALTKWPE
jgi:hypothetical protein